MVITINISSEPLVAYGSLAAATVGQFRSRERTAALGIVLNRFADTCLDGRFGSQLVGISP